MNKRNQERIEPKQNVNQNETQTNIRREGGGGGRKNRKEKHNK